MSEDNKLKNKLIKIKDAKTITDLIDVYEMMINTIDNLSREHIEKVNDFINDLGSIEGSFNDDEKEPAENFNKDPFFIDLLRKNLIHLYTNRLSRKINIQGFKND